MDQLTPEQFNPICLHLLQRLRTHQHYWVFNRPVDPVELGLPDYFIIIQKPMDLGTVQRKIENQVYRTIHEFVADVRLTFENAMFYNETGSIVYAMAEDMLKSFKDEYKALLTRLSLL